MTTATRSAKEIKQPRQLPPPNSDFYDVYETLNAEELAILKQVRRFLETKVAPIITKYWADDAFPFELLPAFKELNIGGLGMHGYGCQGGSLALFGFVAMEMGRIDPSIATFFGVHTGLSMGSIYLDGSEEQKQKWLPPMARMEKIGCFGLTEPLVGSGTAGGLTTTAKREGDTWILNGQKKWIDNSPWCDVSVIWARAEYLRLYPGTPRSMVLRSCGRNLCDCTPCWSRACLRCSGALAQRVPAPRPCAMNGPTAISRSSAPQTRSCSLTWSAPRRRHAHIPLLSRGPPRSHQAPPGCPPPACSPKTRLPLRDRWQAVTPWDRRPRTAAPP